MADPEHNTVLDDAALDRMAGLAAGIVNMPIASISLHAEDRVWSTSAVGHDAAKNLHKTGLCAHLSEVKEPLVVTDTLTDERFRADPLVISSPQIRFYAGFPLVTAGGQPIGLLSIADMEPRTDFDAANAKNLQDLAAVIVDQIVLRQARGLSCCARDTSAAVLVAMSHDIRTPMNGVLGMAEVLLTADDLSDRHRRRIDVIKRSGASLLSTLDRIIDLARLESKRSSPEPEPFDLGCIVQSVMAEVGSQGCGKRLRSHSSFGHARVIGDASVLKRLLRHFLECAAGFASEDVIVVNTDVRTMGGDQVRVRFEIENAGIDGDRLKDIFDAVDQGNISRLDGFDETHLIPIICKRLAAIAKADLGIDQRSRASSAFWLEVDFKAPAGPDIVINSPDAAPAYHGSDAARVIRDVLVAEDNPDMALLIEDFLDEAGYRATIAHDGASALKVLGEQPVDLVLMDGRMPDMSGFETTKLIRQLPDQRADIPIIALTGEALDGDRERFLAAGMDDYVAKPVDYKALISAIERCSSLRRQDAPRPPPGAGNP